MPRTLDRDGNTLAVFQTDQAGARLFRGQWAIRLYDMDGQPTDNTAWIPYTVPNDAVLQRQRRLSIDGGPMTLSLTLLAEALPTQPEQYWRIEVDRVVGHGAHVHWPYFTGIIDKISASFVREGGSIYRTLHLDCFGELQRTKSDLLSSLWRVPARNSNVSRAMIVAERVVVRRDHDTKNGDEERLPTGIGVALDDATYGLQIDNDSAFGSPYTAGGVDYTLVASVSPAKITWAVEPADTRYYRFWRVAYIGRRKITDMAGGPSMPIIFYVPYGRNPYDLFLTRVAAGGYSAGPPVTVTVKDPAPYRSGNSLLDPSVQSEYVVVVQATTGEEIVRQLSSTDASGVLTLASGVTFADGNPPVENDIVRVATTEMYTAWAANGYSAHVSRDYPHRMFFLSGATLNGNITSTQVTATASSGTPFWAGQYILMDTEIMLVTSVAGTTLNLKADAAGNREAQDESAAAAHNNGITIYRELPKGVVKIRPDAGIATLSGGRNLGAGEEVMGKLTWLTEADENRTEEVIKWFLGTERALYAAANVNTSATGYYLKVYTSGVHTADEVVADIKEQALPANTYVTDEPDGDIKIKPYQQTVNPDGDLLDVQRIEEEAGPEPVGAVVVLAAGPEENVAAKWFDRVSYNAATTPGLTNPERIIDGSSGSAATQADAGKPVRIEFQIPMISPAERFPWIDRIDVEGKGYFTAHWEQPQLVNTPRRMIDGWNYRPVGIDGQGSTVTMTQEELVRGLATSSPFDARGTKLVFTVHGIDDSQAGTAAEVAEIRIWVKYLEAWRASLTDDSATDATDGGTGAVPTGWAPTDTETFGAIWWQPNSLKRESYRFAPTSYLKRTATKFAAASRASTRLRTKIIPLDLMHPQNARDYAERYADEFFRVVNSYRVTAPLDDRWERGDTLRVTMPAGKTFLDGTTAKNLLLWEISDGGGRTDMAAEYLLKEYA